MGDECCPEMFGTGKSADGVLCGGVLHVAGSDCISSSPGGGNLELDYFAKTSEQRSQIRPCDLNRDLFQENPRRFESGLNLLYFETRAKFEIDVIVDCQCPAGDGSRGEGRAASIYLRGDIRRLRFL